MRTSLLALFLFAATATAGTYTFDSASGYYLDESGAAYSRVDNGGWYHLQHTSYDYYGRPYYTYGPYYWRSEYSYKPVDPAATYKADGFDRARQQLFSIKAAQSRVEGNIRTRAAETMLLGETAKQLGVSGSFYQNDISGNPFSGYQNSLFLSSAGAQGQTAYGYNASGNASNSYQYKQSVDAFGTTDLNQLYLNAAQLTKGSQDATITANTGFQGLTRDAAAAAARIAEIRARTDAALALIKGTEPTPSTHVETTITGTGTTSTVNSAPPPVLNVPSARFERSAWRKLAGPAKCAACHDAGGSGVARFDLSRFDPQTSPQRSRVMKVMMDGSMPKGGARLSVEEMAQVLGMDADDRTTMPSAK